MKLQELFEENATFAGYADVLKKHGFHKKNGYWISDNKKAGKVSFTKNGEWKLSGASIDGMVDDYTGTIASSLDKHLSKITESKEKAWFSHDRKAWEKAVAKLDVEDDDENSAKCDGKTIARWYPDRDEGWVLTEARTISFADPDREPGAVEREGAARDALKKREKASQGAWEDLIDELGGTITSHRKPGDHNPYGSDRASIAAKLPHGFKISMWRSDVVLEAPKDLPNEDRKAIQMIWKKNGLNLYGMNFMYLGNGDANKYFNGISIGYYSSLQGDEKEARTKAIIATFDYMKDLLDL